MRLRPGRPEVCTAALEHFLSRRGKDAAGRAERLKGKAGEGFPDRGMRVESCRKKTNIDRFPLQKMKL